MQVGYRGLSRTGQGILPVARGGGEEFMVLLHETRLAAGAWAAERLRQRVAEHAFDGPGRITVSLGVAEYAGAEERLQLLKRLDDALCRGQAGLPQPGRPSRDERDRQPVLTPAVGSPVSSATEAMARSMRTRSYSSHAANIVAATGRHIN